MRRFKRIRRWALIEYGDRIKTGLLTDDFQAWFEKDDALDSIREDQEVARVEIRVVGKRTYKRKDR